MDPIEVVVEGTLRSDGTLELNGKPGLPPGRVTVVLRPAPPDPSPAEGWWTFMQAARKRMEEAGCHFMDEDEMRRHLEWLREEDRYDEMLRGTSSPRPKPESPGC